MTDSVAVFPPGFRLTDTAGVPYAGAVVKFFNAGTSTPKTVYADEDLSVSLGTSVTTDAYGYPTSNGTTRTLVYVGTASYKVTAETSAAVTIWSHDEIKGAAAGAEGGGGGGSAEYVTPVETKSLDYTIVDGDQGKVFLTNCSSADVAYTLPSAVTVGAGWRARIEHAGSANQALLETTDSQNIRRGNTTYGASFALTFAGEGVTLVSDGGNWVLCEYSPPFPTPGVGVIAVVDRLSAPPGSPADGALYLLTSSPSGDWSGFTEDDIAQWTGAAWIKFTPATDAGWLAYVQDEDIYYKFSGTAWAALVPAGSTSAAGIVQTADAAAMEAQTADRVVTADLVHRHPGVAKAWLNMNGTGTIAIRASYGIASITDQATGEYRVTLTTAMSSVNYVALATSNISETNATIVSTTVVDIDTQNSGGTDTDSSEVFFAAFGDH